MGLSITVLGCSGTYPGAESACTGYLVQAGRTNVLLDAGSGVLANLQRHIDLRDLSAIVLTHSHPDHWLDFAVLRNALRYVLHVEEIPVYGTTETHDLAQALVGGHLDPTFDWTSVHDGAEARIDDLRLRFSRTDHPVETLAVRIDHGDVSFVFSSDTGPAWKMSSLGADIDLALVEASLSSDDEGSVQHLSGRQAGAMAKEGGANRLVITHVVPGHDGERHRRDAEDTFGGPVELATTHARYEL